MGYYTYYSGNVWDKNGNEMDFINSTDECSLVIKTLATLMQDEYPCDTIEELSSVITEIFDGGSGDLKWYDYEDHMKELAKKFPEYKFELEGFGGRTEATGGSISFTEIRTVRSFVRRLSLISSKT